MTGGDVQYAKRQSAITDALDRVRQEAARLPERPETTEEFWCLVWDQMPDTVDKGFDQPLDDARRAAVRIAALCLVVMTEEVTEKEEG